MSGILPPELHNKLRQFQRERKKKSMSAFLKEKKKRNGTKEHEWPAIFIMFLLCPGI